jgi:hypothetical protein
MYPHGTPDDGALTIGYGNLSDRRLPEAVAALAGLIRASGL